MLRIEVGGWSGVVFKSQLKTIVESINVLVNDPQFL